MTTNTRVLLNNYVLGRSPTLADFKIEKAALPSKDSLKSDQVIVRSLYFSVDSYQQGRLSGATDRYIESFKIGEPIRNSCIGIVEASASPKIKTGDYVAIHEANWETQFVISANEVQKVSVGDGISPIDYVGVFGMPSFTAYIGTVVLGKAKAGETLLVSSAASAVGQMVIQFAKARGLNVVGVAGSDDKVDFIKSIGADDAFNYKTCGGFEDAIKKHCPKGVDIYFDIVGGEFLDATLANINNRARIIVCSMVSQFSVKTHDELHGPKNIMNIITKRASIEGFIIFDYYNTKDEQDFIREASILQREGKIKYKVNETVGLENGPQALLDLLKGKSFGKSVLKV